MQLVRVKLALALAIGVVQSLGMPARALAMGAAPIEESQQLTAQHLVSVTSDKYPNSAFTLTLALDEAGSIQKIHYREKDQLILSFTLGEAKGGVVMLRDTVRVLELFVDGKFDPKSGGEVSLWILRKFALFSSDYRIYRMRMQKTEKGWSLMTSPEFTGLSQPFDQIYLETLKDADKDPDGVALGTGEGKAVGIKLLRMKRSPGWLPGIPVDSRDPTHLVNTVSLPKE